MGNGPEVTEPIGVLQASTKTKLWFFAGLVFLGILFFAAQASANVLWNKGTTAASNAMQGAEGALNSFWS